MEHTLQNSLSVLVKTCIEPQIRCNRLIECDKILEVDKIYSCSTLTLTQTTCTSPFIHIIGENPLATPGRKYSKKTMRNGDYNKMTTDQAT